MDDTVSEDRQTMLRIYCERRSLPLFDPADDGFAFMKKVELILGELVCDLDVLKNGLRIAGRERK